MRGYDHTAIRGMEGKASYDVGINHVLKETSIV